MLVHPFLFAVLFGPGLLADSPAMQWAGFFLLIVYLFLTFLVFVADTLTIEEARAKLDELEAKSK